VHLQDQGTLERSFGGACVRLRGLAGGCTMGHHHPYLQELEDHPLRLIQAHHVPCPIIELRRPGALAAISPPIYAYMKILEYLSLMRLYQRPWFVIRDGLHV
jgi:hypothetical protein